MSGESTGAAHQQVVERAIRWLRGTMRCEPVFSGNASCREIPDAIGWTSRWKFRGSHVVEAKISVEDFRRDQLKKFRWVNPEWKVESYYRASRFGQKEAEKNGFVKQPLPMMGEYRYYMCPEGIITAEMVEKASPDHGLLWIKGRSVRVMRVAPKRTEMLDLHSEVWYLRFAIINKHCCRSEKEVVNEELPFVEAKQVSA